MFPNVLKITSYCTMCLGNLVTKLCHKLTDPPHHAQMLAVTLTVQTFHIYALLSH